MPSRRLLAAGLLLLAAGCPGQPPDGKGQRGAQEARKQQPPKPPSGEALYGEHCARCHGADGDGKGPEAAKLKTRPRAFAAGVYKFSSTKGMPTDADLLRTIDEGVPGTDMSGYATKLGVAERKALVDHVKSLTVALVPARSEKAARRKFGKSFAGLVSKQGKQFARVNLFVRRGPGKPLKIPAPPPVSEKLLALGEDAYNANCANCHGFTGEGDGAIAPTLEDDWGHKILPRDFTKGVFKRGSSPGDLYRLITLGVPGTPMPASDNLTVEQRWGLAYFLRGLVKKKE